MLYKICLKILKIICNSAIFENRKMPPKICLKILMIICNCAIFLGGAEILIIGGLIEVTKKYILRALGGNTEIPPELTQLTNAGYLLIVVGGVITFMGLLGCCGAFCENKCLLKIYFSIIFTMFIVEVIAAVVLLLNRPAVENFLEKIRNKVAVSTKDTYNKNDIITKAWIETMTLMQCCGYHNYTDFEGSQIVNQTSMYPSFCCPKEQTQECDSNNAKSAGVQGCFDVVVNWLTSKATLLGGVAICFGGIEVAAMIACLLLCKS